MTFIETYLLKHNLTIEGLMEGELHFGEERMNEICKEALEKNCRIDFYYKTTKDQISDKLSVRFIKTKG
jgi:hypothetical protein